MLAESPEAPARWSLGCKVLLGSNMCKGKRRRTRLSRGRSLRPQNLEQSEGVLERRLLLSVPCQAEKPGLLPLSVTGSRQTLKEVIAEGPSAVFTPYSGASPAWQGNGQCTSVSATDHHKVFFVLFWQLDG